MLEGVELGLDHLTDRRLIRRSHLLGGGRLDQQGQRQGQEP
jgi:hypothetical protein